MQGVSWQKAALQEQTESPSRDTFARRAGREETLMIKPITFGLIGGDWRAEFYIRIAQALSERFRIAGCVAKAEATRARIKAGWNIRVFDGIDALLNERPEFVVTSVPWAASVG